MMLDKRAGRELSLLRKDRNLSLAVMGVLICEDERQVMRYERGWDPIPEKTLNQLSEFFDIPRDKFLKGDFDGGSTPSRIGYNLRLLRRKNKLTQLDMAELLGISKQAVSNYEEGRRKPPIETLVQISSLFNISIDTIVKEVLR